MLDRVGSYSEKGLLDTDEVDQLRERKGLSNGWGFEAAAATNTPGKKRHVLLLPDECIDAACLPAQRPGISKASLFT